jgi:hypothetical protein
VFALGSPGSAEAACVATPTPAGPRLDCGPDTYTSTIGTIEDNLAIFLTGPATVETTNGYGIRSRAATSSAVEQSIDIGGGPVAITVDGNSGGAVVLTATPVSPTALSLTSVNTSIVTNGFNSPGILANAGEGPISLRHSGSIQTSGQLSNGVNAAGDGDISVELSGPITTTGGAATGVNVHKFHPFFNPDLNGSVDVIVNGPVLTRGGARSLDPTDPKQPLTPSIGVFVQSEDSALHLRVADVTTEGNATSAEGGHAVQVIAAGAAVIEGTGNLTTTGGSSDGIHASSNISVALNMPGAIRVEGTGSSGVYFSAPVVSALLGDITVLGAAVNGVTLGSAIDGNLLGNERSTIVAGVIRVATPGAKGISLRGISQGINIVNADVEFKSLTMSGDHAVGLQSKDSDFAGPALSSWLAVNGAIIMQGSHSTAIGILDDADVRLGGSIELSGANSFGLVARSLGTQPINVNSTMTIHGIGDNSTGVFLVGEGSTGIEGPVNLKSTGFISMEGKRSIGVYADGTGVGAAAISSPVDLDLGSVFAPGEDSIAVTAFGSKVHIRLNGEVLGGSGDLGEGVRAHGEGDVEIDNRGSIAASGNFAVDAESDHGVALLSNAGSIWGFVDVVGPEGYFVNSGRFYASDTSRVSTLLDNTGTIALDEGVYEATIASAVANEGIIELRNDSPDQRLWIGGIYAGGKAAVLGVDAALQTGGSADRLSIAGATSGHTNVFVNNLTAAGVSTLTPTAIAVVDAPGAASDAFILAGGPIASGFTDWNLTKQGDSFNLVNTPNAARVGAAAMLPAYLLDQWSFGFDQIDERVRSLQTVEPMGYAPEGEGTFPMAIKGDAPPRSRFDMVWLRATGHEWTREDAGGDRLTGGGLLGGVDMQRDGVFIPGDRLTVGGFAGFDTGSVDFAGSDVESNLETASLGVHAGYDYRGFFWNSQARFGASSVSLSLPDAQGESGAVLFGAATELGQRFSSAGGFYVEPSAKVTLAYADVEDFDVTGTSVAGDATSIRAGGQLKAGFDGMTRGDYRFDTWLSAGAWGENLSGNSIIGPLIIEAPSRDPVYQFGGGVRVAGLDSRLSAVVDGSVYAGGASGFSLGAKLKLTFGP